LYSLKNTTLKEVTVAKVDADIAPTGSIKKQEETIYPQSDPELKNE